MNDCFRPRAIPSRGKWILLSAFLYILAATDAYAQEESVSRIRILPDTTVVEVGSTFTLTIAAHAAAPVEFAAIHLEYDPTLLQLNGWTEPNMPAMPDVLLGPEAAAGRFVFEAGSGLGNPPVEGDFEVLQLEFQALAASAETALTFDTTAFKTRLLTYRDFQVINALEEVQNAVVVINEKIEDPCAATDLAAAATPDGPLCASEETGGIDLSVTGGSPPFAFSWNNGATTEDLNDLPAGIYRVTVTDTDGCTAVAEAELAALPAISLTAQSTPPSCFGAANGAIDLSIDGGVSPYVVEWNTGDNTEDLSGLAAGTYTVTVTDANGCSVSEEIPLSQPAPFSCSVRQDRPASDGLRDGRATVVPEGGTAPFQYQWDNGETTVTAIQLGAGLHSVTVTDAGGCTTTCQVTITAVGGVDYELVFTGDEAGVCLDESPGVSVNVLGASCDSLLVTRDTARLGPTGDACLRLAITERVINWCEYDGATAEPIRIPEDWDGDGNTSEVHTIRVATRPAQDLSPETPGVQVVAWTQADGDRRFLAEAEYEALTPGFWEFTRLLEISDDVPPEVLLENENLDFCTGTAEQSPCEADVALTLSITDDCTQEAAVLRSVRLDLGNTGMPVDGTGTLYTVTALGGGRYRVEGAMPPGLHGLLISCVDGCGNATVRSFLFRVRDCTPPQPSCLELKEVELLPVDADSDGFFERLEVNVAALDFLIEPVSGCLPEPDIQYRAVTDGELAGRNIEELETSELLALPDSVMFTCEDGPTQLLHVAAVDAAGNRGFCRTVAVINQPPSPNSCEDFSNTPGIQGTIRTAAGAPMEAVLVELQGTPTRFERTATDGAFAFHNLSSDGAYTLRPGLDEAPLNGVSTFDIIQVSKHILGVADLDSPYKMIAADANRSGGISTLDLIHIRKLILNIYTRFPDNTSWRFVPADYVFPDPANPFQEDFPEAGVFSGITGEERIDFIGIKIGDVNESAQPGNLHSVEVRQTGDPFYLNVTDCRLQPQIRQVVDVRSAQLDGLEGLQFTLAVDPEKARIRRVVPGRLEQTQLHVIENGRAVLASWDAYSGRAGARTPLSGEELLCRLVLEVEEEVSLSEVLRVQSAPLRSEAYRTDGALLETALRFLSASPPATSDSHGQGPFLLFQNFPNPLTDVTNIPFRLFEPAEVHLEIRTPAGQRVYTQRQFFPPGDHTLRVEGSRLPASSVLFYSLRVKDAIAVRKMIRLE